jgi:ABC-type multidrug transport system ATPase subunit
MDITAGRKTFQNVGKINLLVGKNGAGKSTWLRTLDDQSHELPNLGIVRYVTPERGGVLNYEGGVETNLQNQNWVASVRRQNQASNFRQIAVSEFRRLETLVLRKIERDKPTRENLEITFDTTVATINRLLDNIEIVRSDNAGFVVRNRGATSNRDNITLSSGESELITLAIEILAFAYQSEDHVGKNNYLLLDEPDVHLHPDLQQRLMHLLVNAIEEREIVAFIATHSTPIIGALSDVANTTVGFLTSGTSVIKFHAIEDSLRKVLPIFGAHPLSNVFNSKPILLVEGEDDERIWQQAARTSQGKVNVWPCAAGDKQSLDDYENQVNSIASAIYENAQAYSLRDRDEEPYEIDDKPIVKRMRLHCRAAENLILSDDVLEFLGVDWPSMKTAIEDWLSKFTNHQQFAAMKAFQESGYDRSQSDLKELRNVLMMLAGSQKPWEVAVGQAIAGLLNARMFFGADSLPSYLGSKLVDTLDLKRRSRFPSRTERNT